MTPEDFRAALAATGRSQHGLARELGMSISAVNRWANGRAEVPAHVQAYLNLAQRVASLGEPSEEKLK